MAAESGNGRTNDLERETLTTSWLASRLGIEPMRIARMRKAGELIGFNPPGSREFFFPCWQFDADGKPLPVVPRLVRLARERGLADADLYEVLTRRSGLTGDTRLADALREGNEEYVVAAVEAATRARS